AACESGGNPRAVGGGGAFRGKYQFDYGTWASVGGHGDPAAAPETEQDRRAALLYSRAGATPWPVCGREARAPVAWAKGGGCLRLARRVPGPRRPGLPERRHLRPAAA